jgi:UDP-2-acetamido-2,6-beta-L-arabino-hexul-4-ose reductase
VERDNPFIAERLVQTCRAIEARPHIVYSNSTHSSGNTPYGRGKARAAEILGGLGSGFTDLVLPHIFGEGARPYYNNVTATLIDQIISGDAVTVNSGGTVSLLHAGKAAEIAIESGISRMSHRINPAGRAVLVSDLCELLTQFHRLYSANVYPSLQDDFTVALFNSYRSAIYPSKWPRALKLNSDARGHLFEAVKGGGGGQTFLSSTAVGERRGDHFHLNKVERFLVLQGDAVIRIRPVLGEKIYEYRVSGDTPAVVDIPTLHTHSIENVGDDALMTLFWAHEHFDPDNPDTFADRVLL